MLDVIIRDGTTTWKSLKFTALHGALIGFGLGAGMATAVLVLMHFFPQLVHP